MFSELKRETRRYKKREEQHAKCCFKGTSRSETRLYSADQIKEAFATNTSMETTFRRDGY